MTKISNLTVGSTPSGSEKLPAVQSSQSVSLTVDQISQHYKERSPRTETDSTTLVAADAFGSVEINAGTGKSLTVPQDSSVNFKIGTQIKIAQTGSGQITIGGSGITFRSPGSATKTRAQYSIAVLEKRAANDWFIGGDITT